MEGFFPIFSERNKFSIISQDIRININNNIINTDIRI